MELLEWLLAVILLDARAQCRSALQNGRAMQALRLDRGEHVDRARDCTRLAPATAVRTCHRIVPH